MLPFGEAQDFIPHYYPYPYYWYPPELHHVTYLNETFPEHHAPLYDARHKFAQGLHNFWKDTWPQPRADVYETGKRYYIDVELPGVDSKDQIKLKWTNSRTLALEVEKPLRQFPEEQAAVESAKAAEAGAQAAAKDASEEGQGAKHGAHSKPHHTVHHVIKERDLGKLKRAFCFPVSIDREGMTAKLHHGMLEIVLTKLEDAPPAEHHEVAIEHADGEPNKAA